jgi:pimeloyl-ACP methyl ester carboxylesterase
VLALVAALLAFVYAEPVSVLETSGELRLRLRGVRSAHVQAGPYLLRYLESGAGEPLVLVHGLGSNAMQDWGRLVPVLVIWGKQDRLIPAAYAAPLQAEFPHAALQLLDDCGHVPMADCPEAFDRELAEFLAAVPPGAAP